MKKIKLSKRKILIIVSICLIIFSFFVLIFDLWRYSPFSTKIAVNKISKLSETSPSCREDCNYFLNYFSKIICQRKKISLKNSEKIVQILYKTQDNQSFQLALINSLENNYCMQRHPNLALAISEAGKSGHLNWIDKKNLSLAEKNNMIISLQKIIEDDNLPLTQRKVAFRSLWTVFGDQNLFSFYKEIISSETSDLLLLEAIKAISNLDNKSENFKLSDLNLYREVLARKHEELEKLTLFLLRDYYEFYGLEVKNWLSKQNISPANSRLLNELFS